MINGINVDCIVGPFEVLRSPRIKFVNRRRDVVSSCQIDVPDPFGEIYCGLAKRQNVKIRFGLRGAEGFRHEWDGFIKDFVQVSVDMVRVSCVGLEQKLIDAKVKDGMHGEPADVVGRRILAASGLPVAEVSIPPEIFPHMVFSNVTAARAVKQLTQTLESAFGHDMSKHAVWLGKSGLRWSAGNEPGQIYVVETAQNMIANSPNPDGMSTVVSTLLPGLAASRQFRLHDTRHGMDAVYRVEEVVHMLSDSGNTTTIGYDIDQGWG